MQPKDRNIQQCCRNAEAYQSLLKKDYCERFTMLSSMRDNIIEELEKYHRPRDLESDYDFL